MSLPLPVHDAAYGGASLAEWSDTNRADADLGGKNDRLPIDWQCCLV
jgi:hypothetical protein